MKRKPSQTERTGRTGRFDNSRNRVDAILLVVTVLCSQSLYQLGADAVPIVTAGVTGMLALVGGWTYVTNKAEVDLPILPAQKPPEDK